MPQAALNVQDDDAYCRYEKIFVNFRHVVKRRAWKESFILSSVEEF